jgi:hypothetical protein
MSKDFTPREKLLVGEYLGGKGNPWDELACARKTKWVDNDGTSRELVENEVLDYMEQFKYISRIGLDVSTYFYKKYKEKPEACLKVLQKVDNCLMEYIDNKNSIDDTVSKWFEGKLDKNFYYSEQNDKALLEYMDEMLQSMEES